MVVARSVELARLMNTRPQEVTRITDHHHSPKIDTIGAAFPVMGKRLDLRLAWSCLNRHWNDENSLQSSVASTSEVGRLKPMLGGLPPRPF